MQRERPTAVLVLAILNFVFGGLGIAALCCGAMAAGLLAAVFNLAPTPRPGQPAPPNLMEMFQSIPGYIPFLIVSLILGLLVSILLIISGVGLLRMQNWARVVCLVYAIYTLLSTIGGTVYTLTVVNPATDAWERDYARRTGTPIASNPAVKQATTIGTSCFGMAYPIALLIVLNLPHVRAAFAGSPTRRPRDEDDEFPDTDDRFRDRDRRSDDYDDRVRGE
jgi:hypothetical protein